MKRRLLKVSSYYPEYLNWFYSTQSNLKFQSYDVQFAALMADSFAWSDFWMLQLEASGQFEVTETVVNAEFLQKRWAEESGVQYGSNWALDILTSQILELKPDILFAQDYWLVTPEFIRKLKSFLPTLKVVGYDGIGLNDPERFTDFDLMLVLLESSSSIYNQSGIRAIQIKAGFSPEVLKRLGQTEKRGAATFVGSLALFQGGHYSRLGLLHYLTKQIDIDLYIAGLEDFSLASLATAKQILKGRWRTVIATTILKKKANPPVFGLKMYETLASSPITLNIHIDRAGEQAANMRLFEATGVGACLLTDWKKNLSELFRIDEEIVVFRSKEECLEKLRYLIANPGHADRIARAGQSRTLSSHSLSSVIDHLKSILLEM